jgi:hypothetical protein
MTSHERTVVRADVLAARLFHGAAAMDQRAGEAWRELAAASFEAAAEFVREAARRNSLTGETLNDGLPADVEEPAVGVERELEEGRY